MSYQWEKASDEELLQMRICDLGLTLERSGLEEYVHRLYEELAARSIVLRPQVYLSDEWFSPEGDSKIAVPFFLANPRLRQLERKMFLEVEGDTPEWFMRLLRHEAGHAIDHAYRFSKRKKWQSLFGDPSKEYDPDTYRPKPFSRSFVRNLDNWYAQSHPDEDWAETFAVWLDPNRDWRQTYRGWTGALKKLEYLNELMTGVVDKPPRFKGSSECEYEVRRIRMKLETHYKRRMREYAGDLPDFYDSDLLKIFVKPENEKATQIKAAVFMRRNKKAIVNSIADWTGESKFTTSKLLSKLIGRCHELKLRLVRSEDLTLLELTAYVTSLIKNYLFTGKFKRSV